MALEAFGVIYEIPPHYDDNLLCGPWPLNEEGKRVGDAEVMAAVRVGTQDNTDVGHFMEQTPLDPIGNIPLHNLIYVHQGNTTVWDNAFKGWLFSGFGGIGQEQKLAATEAIFAILRGTPYQSLYNLYMHFKLLEELYTDPESRGVDVSKRATDLADTLAVPTSILAQLSRRIGQCVINQWLEQGHMSDEYVTELYRICNLYVGTLVPVLMNYYASEHFQTMPEILQRCSDVSLPRTFITYDIDRRAVITENNNVEHFMAIQRQKDQAKKEQMQQEQATAVLVLQGHPDLQQYLLENDNFGYGSPIHAMDDYLVSSETKELTIDALDSYFNSDELPGKGW